MSGYHRMPGHQIVRMLPAGQRLHPLAPRRDRRVLLAVRYMNRGGRVARMSAATSGAVEQDAPAASPGAARPVQCKYRSGPLHHLQRPGIHRRRCGPAAACSKNEAGRFENNVTLERPGREEAALPRARTAAGAADRRGRTQPQAALCNRRRIQDARARVTKPYVQSGFRISRYTIKESKMIINCVYSRCDCMRSRIHASVGCWLKGGAPTCRRARAAVTVS